jgi:hypothetical protein
MTLMNTEMTDRTEYFLDASVARPILLGTSTYQQYFKVQLGDKPCYISPYVRMEIHRSYLRNIIEFYFTLRSPQITNLSDCLILWSNRFQSSKHKAIQQMIAQLIERGAGNPEIFRHKNTCLIELEQIIRALVESLQTIFVNTENDSTCCSRATIGLNLKAENFSEELTQFADVFDDVKSCRSKCRIDQFLLADRKTEIEAYVQQKNSLSQNSNSRGFLKITEALEDVLLRGADACSCRQCERIGDAVIALDAPREMQIEHTDHSFDYLCPPIQQPHRKHPPETQIVSSSS